METVGTLERRLPGEVLYLSIFPTYNSRMDFLLYAKRYKEHVIVFIYLVKVAALMNLSVIN